MKKNNSEILLEIKNLKKHFEISKGFFGRKTEYLKAIDGIDFEIARGETFGLVGESGCGKTTVARSVIRLYDITEGEINYDGTDIAQLKKKELQPFKTRIQMVFQDPYASLNTRMSISEILSEPLRVHNIVPESEVSTRVTKLLEMVGLSKEHAFRYPHEFSGGQRQRIGIARALTVEPEFIICDEPTSALDVSVQAQVLNMLEDFQEKLGLTYLFIAHDLAMIQHISDRIGVMYLGKMVEVADSTELYKNPLHPYTKALMSAIPSADPDESESQQREILEGDVPSPINLPSGCRFRTRCKECFDLCELEEPKFIEVSKGHKVACHLVSKMK